MSVCSIKNNTCAVRGDYVPIQTDGQLYSLLHESMKNHTFECDSGRYKINSVRVIDSIKIIEPPTHF